MRSKDLSMLILREVGLSMGPVGAKILAGTLDIPQATVGRALARLEKLGLIQSVSNKGRQITVRGQALLREQSAADNKAKIAHDLVSLSFDGNKQRLLEVMRIREMLEPDGAARAAQLVTDENLVELENYAFGHRYRLSQGQTAYEEDLGFHLAIARLSGNQTLHKVLELLLTDNNAYVEFSRAGEAERDAQVSAHFQILEAIRSRDPDAACAAMTGHLSHVIRDVMRVFEMEDVV